MAAPHEIIAAPYTVYLARTGTAFPRVDAREETFVRSELFFKLGTSGTKNYDDAGVTVSHPQSMEVFRGAGATAPRKAFRTEEDFIIALTVVDVSPGMYAKILNDARITTVAAAERVAGEQSFEILRGLNVTHFAILVRGMSTIENELTAQYECPAGIEDGSPAVNYTKGRPASLECQFRAIDAAGTGVGTLRVQSAVAR